jgi:hypothetical protein
MSFRGGEQLLLAQQKVYTPTSKDVIRRLATMIQDVPIGAARQTHFKINNMKELGQRLCKYSGMDGRDFLCPLSRAIWWNG